MGSSPERLQYICTSRRQAFTQGEGLERQKLFMYWDVVNSVIVLRPVWSLCSVKDWPQA